MTQQQINTTIRVIFSLILIFILLNIDYSYNFRTYTLLPKAPSPKIEIIEEDDKKQKIKLTKCLNPAGKFGYFMSDNQSNGSKNYKFLEEHSVQRNFSFIEVTKNKDVKISLACESSFIPMRWTNYNF